MPLHIDIRVNETLINTLHIARVKGGTKPDDINDYLIVDGPKPTRYEDWLIDGIPFTHRYGDGAEVCVMKGIQAMHGYEGYITAEVFDAGVDQERERDDDYEIKSWTLGNDTDCETCGMSWNEAEFDPHFNGENKWSFHYRVGCFDGASLFSSDEDREEKLEEMLADLSTFPGWPEDGEKIVREMIEECERARES